MMEHRKNMNCDCKHESICPMIDSIHAAISDILPGQPDKKEQARKELNEYIQLNCIWRLPDIIN